VSKKIQILFIDDQKDFLDAMTFLLKKGYDVSTALNGPTGIERIRQGDIDIVFVDFRMPGMDGIETIKKIREFNKTVQIVIVTAHADDAMIREMRSLNISGFFSKMGEFEELEGILRVVIRSVERAKGEDI
jgi:DNA-binding NarL/FixJ family response regulator